MLLNENDYAAALFRKEGKVSHERVSELKRLHNDLGQRNCDLDEKSWDSIFLMCIHLLLVLLSAFIQKTTSSP